MTGPKLNEYPVRRPGVRRAPVTAEQPFSYRARARYVRMSAYKAREVLDLIRGEDAERAQEILRFVERDAASVIGKVLGSAIANAENSNNVEGRPKWLPDELYVSACYADEGPTLKRWRPRARGRATRIRKRTCHITVVVSRLPEEDLARRGTRSERAAAERRRRRAGQQAADARRRRRGGAPEEAGAEDEADLHEAAEPETAERAAEGVEARASDVDEAAIDTAEDDAPADDAPADESPPASEADAPDTKGEEE